MVRLYVNTLAHIVAILTVIIWGSTFVFTKLLLQSGLSPAHIFTLRFIIAYILLLAFSLTRHNHRWLCNSWRHELLMFALGVTGGALYFLAENEALNHTTTTNVSLIVCSCPLTAALIISRCYNTYRLTKRQVAGTLLAAIGVAVVVLNGQFVLHLSPKGDSLALLANLCWALYSLFMIPANRQYNAVFITRKVFFYGLLAMIPYYIIIPGWPSADTLLQTDVLTNLFFLGAVASMICYLAWTWVMHRLGAIQATNYVYLNPLATIIFASLILAEPITPFFLLGSLLILTGMYWADRK